ncbi:hypothetical protein Franean1_3103 [Parafrankia sp. EAN1pec]|nr:hypothetical protein Franean1_3103 [Frankia sp. EAN1pec]
MSGDSDTPGRFNTIVYQTSGIKDRLAGRPSWPTAFTDNVSAGPLPYPRSRSAMPVHFMQAGCHGRLDREAARTLPAAAPCPPTYGSAATAPAPSSAAILVRVCG